MSDTRDNGILDHVIQYAALREDVNLSRPEKINEAVEAHVSEIRRDLGDPHRAVTEVKLVKDKLLAKYGPELVKAWEEESPAMDGITEKLFLRNKKIREEEEERAAKKTRAAVNPGFGQWMRRTVNGFRHILAAVFIRIAAWLIK